VERVFYRGGDGLTFKPTRFEYVIYSDDPADVKALTDHRMMECVLRLGLENYARPADAALAEPQKPSAFLKLFADAWTLVRFVAVVLAAGVAYVAKSYPTAFVCALVLVALLVFVPIRVKKRRNIKSCT
jgi:hypothetical protein